MMRSVTIVSAHYNAARQHVEVVKEIEDDDGSTSFMLHVFPAGALEQRAAEYGTMNLSEALDIILWEPHMDEPYSPLQVDSITAHTEWIPAIQSKAQQLGGKARGNIKVRMQVAGLAQHHIDAADVPVLDVVQTHVLFERETIMVLRAHVEQMRDYHRSLAAEKERRQEVKEALTGAARATAVRQQLFRQENMRREGSRRP